MPNRVRGAEQKGEGKTGVGHMLGCDMRRAVRGEHAPPDERGGKHAQGFAQPERSPSFVSTTKPWANLFRGGKNGGGGGTLKAHGLPLHVANVRLEWLVASHRQVGNNASTQRG